VWEITEDTQYANLLASEDLCLIKYLMWFVRNKISALKIEGRTKSNSYLAPVLDVYKTALKDIGQKSFRPKEYLRELEKNCSRPLATGFFLPQKRKTVLSPPTKEKTRPVLAKIIDQETPTSWQVSIRHQWSAQRGFHIIVPGLHRPFVRPHEYCLENNHGIKQSVVHPGQTARLRCDHPQLKTSFFLRSSNYS
jgi:putative protease